MKKWKYRIPVIGWIWAWIDCRRQEIQRQRWIEAIESMPRWKDTIIRYYKEKAIFDSERKILSNGKEEDSEEGS